MWDGDSSISLLTNQIVELGCTKAAGRSNLSIPAATMDSVADHLDRFDNASGCPVQRLGVVRDQQPTIPCSKGELSGLDLRANGRSKSVPKLCSGAAR